MWKDTDHFHYVYKKVSGDINIEAAIEFVGSSPAAGSPDPHRKACLLIRQSLESDAVYRRSIGRPEIVVNVCARAGGEDAGGFMMALKL